MRTLIYSLQTAFKSLWHEKWINFLTVLSVSIGLLILGSFIMITLNLDSVLTRWSRGFGIVVYLDDALKRNEEYALREVFQKDPDVLEVKYISKEDAVRELSRILDSDALILEELEDNPLPSSFELKLKQELLDPSSVERKAAQIKKMEGVAEVQYGEKWLSSLNTISEVFKAGAMFLGAGILVAIIFVSYNTIKILFYRRKEEIETLKLLGATRWFIRLPFLIEGFFIGAAGGVLSAAGLFSVHVFIAQRGVEIIPAITIILISVPLKLYIGIPLAGALMSLAGSFIAVGKIRY